MAVCVSVAASSSVSASGAACTVTVCAVFQPFGAKLNHSVSTAVPCPAPCSARAAWSLPMRTATSPVGCVFSASAYVAVSSSFTPRDVGSGTSPRSSSSVTVHVTAATRTSAYSAAPVVSPCVSVTRSSAPSKSACAAAVTACAVAHVAAVNVSAAGVRLTTAASLLVIPTVTGPVGAASSTTV